MDNNKKNDVIRTFQNFPPKRNVVRNNRANIITGQQGPQTKTQNTAYSRTAFEVYFTADIVQSIVLHTNIKIQNMLDRVVPQSRAKKMDLLLVLLKKGVLCVKM